MKTLTRCAVIGAIAVAALAVCFAALLRSPAPQASEGVVFLSGQPTDVKSVTVDNESGKFSFFFDFDENGYVLDDIPPYIADLDAFVAFMGSSARLSAVRAIPKREVALQESGLLTPSAQVRIEFFDGETVSLTIGGAERISGNYYAMVEGFDDVFIIPNTIARQFLLPKTQIISRFVTPPLHLSSPLSAIRDITFTGGGFDLPVTVQSAAGNLEAALAAISFGAPTHIVQGASVYQLDQTYGAEIFGSLFGITGDIAGYGLNGEEIAAFGFGNPYMTIEYGMVNGVEADERRMLLKIAEAGDGTFYAMLDDVGAVFAIGREPFLDIRFEKLLLRWFLTPLLMDLSGVVVQAPGMDYRFDIDNSDARNPVITYRGQELDAERFRSFFRLITSAAHDGTYLGALPSPQGEALLSITYEYALDKQPDTLALYPGSARRANVYVNGTGEFAMKDLFAQRVREGCENVISGNPIEENW